MVQALRIAEGLEIPVEQLIGESVAVLGIKGSGKTNTTAVLIEQLLSHLPLTIVDREGEYWGLKEKHQLLIAGRGKRVELPLDLNNARPVALYSIRKGLPVILDLSGYDDEEEMNAVLVEYFRAIWDEAGELRRPYQVVLEEAHEFIPQGMKSDVKTWFTRIALRGRKRGLGMIVSSQRSAKVEKDVLTQAGIVFLHKVVHPIDMKVYQDMLPIKARDVAALVGKLTTGEAVFMVNHQVQTVHINLRETYHAGFTPGLEGVEPPSMQPIDENLLKELRAMLAIPAEKPAPAAKAGDAPTVAAFDSMELLNMMRAMEEMDKTQKKLIADNAQLFARLAAYEMAAAKPVTPVEVARKKLLPGHDVIGDLPMFATPAGQPSATIAKLGAVTQEVYRSPGQSQRAIKRQRTGFETFLSNLALLHPYQQDFIAYLLMHPERTWTVLEIARHIGTAESTLKKNMPLDYVRNNLILRTGSRGYYKYQGRPDRWLEQTYPDLNQNELREQLFLQLKIKSEPVKV